MVLELAPPASSDGFPIAGGSGDAHSVGHSVDHSTSHVDFVVAALFVGLCASVLGRLFGVTRGSRVTVSSGVLRSTLGLASLSVLPARSPTAPGVQVFRL
jgi:hypothetical protein